MDVNKRLVVLEAAFAPDPCPRCGRGGPVPVMNPGVEVFAWLSDAELDALAVICERLTEREKCPNCRQHDPCPLHKADAIGVTPCKT